MDYRSVKCPACTFFQSSTTSLAPLVSVSAALQCVGQEPGHAGLHQPFGDSKFFSPAAPRGRRLISGKAGFEITSTPIRAQLFITHITSRPSAVPER